MYLAERLIEFVPYRHIKPTMKCAKCGKDGAEKKCSQCQAVAYCGRDCQREHWKAHKKQCSTLAKAKLENASENVDKGTMSSQLRVYEAFHTRGERCGHHAMQLTPDRASYITSTTYFVKAAHK